MWCSRSFGRGDELRAEKVAVLDLSGIVQPLFEAPSGSWCPQETHGTVGGIRRSDTRFRRCLDREAIPPASREDEADGRGVSLEKATRMRAEDRLLRALL